MSRKASSSEKKIRIIRPLLLLLFKSCRNAPNKTVRANYNNSTVVLFGTICILFVRGLFISACYGIPPEFRGNIHIRVFIYAVYIWETTQTIDGWCKTGPIAKHQKPFWPKLLGVPKVEVLRADLSSYILYLLFVFWAVSSWISLYLGLTLIHIRFLQGELSAEPRQSLKDAYSCLWVVSFARCEMFFRRKNRTRKIKKCARSKHEVSTTSSNPLV